MEIKVIRDSFTETTLGKLYIDGVFFCDTLEDKVRDKKEYGITAIPAGKYQVVINWSNRFKQYMPLLINVPNYEGVRIHPGNKHEDSHGCILVGKRSGKHLIINSRTTYKSLFAKMKAVEKKEKIWIEIE